MYGFLRRASRLIKGISPKFYDFCLNLATLWLLPKARDIRPEANDPVWVVGCFKSPTGLGEGVRLYFQELAECGLKAGTSGATYAVNIERPGEIDGLFQGRLFTPQDPPEAPRRGTVVFHCNPPVLLWALYSCRRFLTNKRVIGFLLWELEMVPDSWRRVLSKLDEVYCPSVFAAEAVRKATVKPVSVRPYRLPERPVIARSFAEDGVVRVLSIFDLGSNFYRKNPLAAVRAFNQAYGPGPGAELTLKAGSVENHPREWALLQEAIEGAPNIKALTSPLDGAGLRALYGGADIYLSLHRSEGYGLTLREAMAYGLEVVATGWSANVDFMAGPKCHAVSFKLVPVDDPSGFYARDQRWAEADVDEAAGILRALADKKRPGLERLKA
ncbi:MAG: glycosyltransferase [Candidatus Adiutrix sp.]|jgi:glycosyltransferase involved in cell wall biosynthesis|nr:glycosyltransferase [Candidatus Adiutrix sp.]